MALCRQAPLRANSLLAASIPRSGPRSCATQGNLTANAGDEGSGDPSSPPAPGCIPLAVDAAHAEVFDLEEFLDAVFRAFAADAALLRAAEGGALASGISVEMMPSLMPTMPYSSASATRQMRPMSRL